MPEYEYRCKECGYEFSTLQSIKEEPLSYCGKFCPNPDVQEGEVKRLLSKNVSVIFKGTGFYETDYKKKENKK